MFRPAIGTDCFVVLGLTVRFAAANAPNEIAVPLKVKFEIEQALSGKSTSPNAIGPLMWDSAQKHVFATIRTDIVPKFVQHLREKREKQADMNLERGKLSLKSVLTEQDKQIKSCDNCMAPFSFTKSRNFCRYCGNVYCTPCVGNSVILPPEFGVANNERVKVCDMCAGVLAGRPRHHAFSFVSPKRNKPLNLAAESEQQMRVWIAALNKAISNSGARTAAMSVSGGSGGSMLGTSLGVSATAPGASSPLAAATATTATPSSAAIALDPKTMDSQALSNGETGLSSLPNGPVLQGVITTVDGVLHLEGWLQKEDPVCLCVDITSPVCLF